MYAKFLVISFNKNDIEFQRFKVEIEIKELSKINAARLLLTSAVDCPNLKKFQSAQSLAEHKIFQLISYKPEGILQVASLLNQKTLDEIVQEKEQQQQKEEDDSTNEQEKSLEFGEFSWIMNISYRDL